MNTEFYASDPNLGHIQATAGYAGIDDLNVAGTRIWACIAIGFRVRRTPAGYTEEDGSRFGHDNGMDLRLFLRLR